MEGQRICSQKRITQRTITIFIICLISQSSCAESGDTKSLDDPPCHSCPHSQDVSRSKEDSFVGNIIDTVSEFCEKYVFVNNTERDLSRVLENAIDEALKKDKYEIFDGFEIKAVNVNETERSEGGSEARALFSSYTYEYRLFKKIQDFVNTHILSINLPKAARLIGFRCKY